MNQYRIDKARRAYSRRYARRWAVRFAGRHVLCTDAAEYPGDSWRFGSSQDLRRPADWG